MIVGCEIIISIIYEFNYLQNKNNTMFQSFSFFIDFIALFSSKSLPGH